MDGRMDGLDAQMDPPRAHKGTQVGSKRSAMIGDGWMDWILREAASPAARPQGHASRGGGGEWEGEKGGERDVSLAYGVFILFTSGSSVGKARPLAHPTATALGSTTRCSEKPCHESLATAYPPGQLLHPTLRPRRLAPPLSVPP